MSVFQMRLFHVEQLGSGASDRFKTSDLDQLMFHVEHGG
jgi:hypothetical protein